MQSAMDVITMLDVCCSLLWSSLLCKKIIAVRCIFHYYVAFVLQCAVFFINMLDVYSTG